jgi:hypothetical protein
MSRSRIKLSAEDRENIRTGVAKIVYEEFVKELQNNLRSGLDKAHDIGKR